MMQYTLYSYSIPEGGWDKGHCCSGQEDLFGSLLPSSH